MHGPSGDLARGAEVDSSLFTTRAYTSKRAYLYKLCLEGKEEEKLLVASDADPNKMMGCKVPRPGSRVAARELSAELPSSPWPSVPGIESRPRLVVCLSSGTPPPPPPLALARRNAQAAGGLLVVQGEVPGVRGGQEGGQKGAVPFQIRIRNPAILIVVELSAELPCVVELSATALPSVPGRGGIFLGGPPLCAKLHGVYLESNTVVPACARNMATHWKMCKFASMSQGTTEPQTSWSNLLSHFDSKRHIKTVLAYVEDKWGKESAEYKDAFAQLYTADGQKKRSAQAASRGENKESQKDESVEDAAQVPGEQGDGTSAEPRQKRRKAPNGFGKRRMGPGAKAEAQAEDGPKKPTRTTFERGCQTAFRTTWKCVHRHHSQADYESPRHRNKARGGKCKTRHASRGKR